MKIQITDVTNGTARGKANCAARAFSLAEGISFEEAEKILRKHTDYNPDKGVTPFSYMQLLSQYGYAVVYKKVRLNDTAHERLPQKAILLYRDHVNYYENGVIFDSGNTLWMAGYRQAKGYFQKVDKVISIK